MEIGICQFDIGHCENGSPFSLIVLSSHALYECPGGGIGRHAILRGWWPYGRASSTLVLGTKVNSAAGGGSTSSGMDNTRQEYERVHRLMNMLSIMETTFYKKSSLYIPGDEVREKRWYIRYLLCF